MSDYRESIVHIDAQVHVSITVSGNVAPEVAIAAAVGQVGQLDVVHVPLITDSRLLVEVDSSTVTSLDATLEGSDTNV